MVVVVKRALSSGTSISNSVWCIVFFLSYDTSYTAASIRTAKVLARSQRDRRRHRSTQGLEMNKSYNQVTDADESVYNLIPRAQELTQRPPIHKSRVSSSLKQNIVIINAARVTGICIRTTPCGDRDSGASLFFYVSTQFPGKIDPHEFDFGGRRSNPHATFGRPNGDNAIPPTAILYKHSKEQVLPDRECIPASMPICLMLVAILLLMKRTHTVCGVARLMGPTRLPTTRVE